MRPQFKIAASAAAALLLLSGVAGCSTFRNRDEAQAAVNQRVIGMQVGDFFQRYGNWWKREEQVDGNTEYVWVSAIGATTNSGYYGLDDRTCTMHVVARSGKITVAEIVQDMPGRTSTSRCREMFKEP